ncbi:hypothetical protein BVRB_6g146020 [Beta vulgaris subsp. vulgaris]|nr:hypothetical protein BVRB_6g146020 [Beta vulgaris subsp. vulgaris]
MAVSTTTKDPSCLRRPRRIRVISGQDDEERLPQPTKDSSWFMASDETNGRRRPRRIRVVFDDNHEGIELFLAETMNKQSTTETGRKKMTVRTGERREER